MGLTAWCDNHYINIFKSQLLLQTNQGTLFLPVNFNKWNQTLFTTGVNKNLVTLSIKKMRVKSGWIHLKMDFTLADIINLQMIFFFCKPFLQSVLLIRCSFSPVLFPHLLLDNPATLSEFAELHLIHYWRHCKLPVLIQWELHLHNKTNKQTMIGKKKSPSTYTWAKNWHQKKFRTNFSCNHSIPETTF